MKRYLFALMFLAFVCGCTEEKSPEGGSPVGEAGKDEISSFHAELRLMHDQSFVLTETFNVATGPELIIYGVQRLFPSFRAGEKGKSEPIEYKPVKFLLDNEELPIGKDIEFGNQKLVLCKMKGGTEVKLRPGQHLLWAQYRVINAIERRAGADFLSWNLMGSGLGVPFRRVELEVFFPPGVPFSPAKLQLIARYNGKEEALGVSGVVTEKKSLRVVVPRQVRPGEEIIAKLRW